MAGRRGWLTASVLVLAGLLIPAQTASAALFISEIFLAGAGQTPGPAVEVSGVGAAGATLLVVDARPERRLAIRRSFTLTSPGSTLLGEAATLDTLFPARGPGIIPGTLEVPAFGLPLTDPVALVVIEGTAALSVGTPLDPPATVAAELARRPIADWVTLGPGTTPTQAEAGTAPIGRELAAALGIDRLPRPIAPIQGVTAWARPVVDGQPQLDQLLPGSITRGISGSPGGLRDFPVSPGAANPETAATSLPPVLPEPSTAAITLGVALAASLRRKRGDCRTNAARL